MEIRGGWEGEGPERNDGAVLTGTCQPGAVSQEARELHLDFHPHPSHVFSVQLGIFL